jgi:molybdenum cofactor synthesis domain-containing protein
VSDAPAITAAVLTVSDRCAAGTAVDASGPRVEEALISRLNATVAARALVPDDIPQIEALLRDWSKQGVHLIVTTGGTGFSPRDVTPEAAMGVIDRPAMNLMELARARCGAASPKAYLSRGVAGVAGRSIIVTLPGSPKGAVEMLDAMCDLLPHAVALVQGTSRSHG